MPVTSSSTFYRPFVSLVVSDDVARIDNACHVIVHNQTLVS